MHISIHELKAKLSATLAKVQAGEPVEVTSHRRVIARIVGVHTGSQTGINVLLSKGLAQWSGGKPKGATIQLGPGKLMSDMVLEDRQ